MNPRAPVRERADVRGADKIPYEVNVQTQGQNSQMPHLADKVAGSDPPMAPC